MTPLPWASSSWRRRSACLRRTRSNGGARRLSATVQPPEAPGGVPTHPTSRGCSLPTIHGPILKRREFLWCSHGTSAAAAAGVVGYTFAIEPHWLEVVERSLPIAELPQP